jgi:trans-aconitate methyltransferase
VHWDAAYAEKGADGVSWFAPNATRVLDLLDRLAVPASASVLDAGGGASPLVDGLLTRGHRDITVLDVSAAGLALARQRLGERATEVDWVVADLRTWHPARTFGIWHDRAVLHFMVTTEDRGAYVEALRAGTAPGSLVVLATFAPDGPDQCSGLPVTRYDAAGLAALLGPEYAPVENGREQHVTPWNTTQAFTCAVFRRH